MIHALHELPGWERRAPAHAPADRPAGDSPRRSPTACTCAPRVTPQTRAALLNAAAIFVPGVDGLRRVTLEAAAAGCAIAHPPGVDDAARARSRGGGPARRGRCVARARRCTCARRGRAAGLRRSRSGARRALLDAAARAAASATPADPLADRPWIVADLHMHTSWSHDCSIDAAELVDHAEAEGLGAIAVTDHNVFGGALEAADHARGRDLIVIPGEEVKTDGAGRGDRPLPRARDPARDELRRTRSPRSASRTASSTSRTRSTACTRSRTRGRCTATSPRSTSSRSTTPGSSSRPTTTRRCGSPASTT